jgi:hypothetical protein
LPANVLASCSARFFVDTPDTARRLGLVSKGNCRTVEPSSDWISKGCGVFDDFHRRMKARLRRIDNPGILRYRSYDFVPAKVTSCRPLLLKIIRAAATSASRQITLTVRGAALLPPRDRTGLTMLTAMAAIFIILSIGILIAHALDAFRSR